MKLCIDCKHFKRNTGSRAQYEHECWVNISLVTGKRYPVEAEKARMKSEPYVGCGTLGNLFEPKDDN